MSSGPISLLAVKEELDALKASHERIVVRTTALQAMVTVLAWGIGKPRQEVAQRILATGVASLPNLQNLPPHLEKELSDVMNSVYAQIVNDDIGPATFSQGGQSGG
jgi:hypothetical protein